MSWTDDRVSLLKKLWGEGHTAAEIAKELGGVTRNAVIGKAHRLKLSNRVSPIQQNTKKPVPQASNSNTAKPVTAERKVVGKVSISTAGTTASNTSVKPAVSNADLRAQALARPSKLYDLTDLKPRMCRWPYGDPKDDNFGFCGCTVHNGLPYCPDHAKIAYQAATRNRILKAATHEAASLDTEEQIENINKKQSA